jgi:DDE family transposase
MCIVDRDEAVKVSVDSTFMKVYSRRGRKGCLSDRGARVGKTERQSYELGWGIHTVTSMSALPLTYVARAPNVNDKQDVKPLLKQASRLIKRCGKCISHVIADRQYYSAAIFSHKGIGCGASHSLSV